MFREPVDGDDIFTIHELLSRRECEELIARSEAIGYEAAAVGGENVPQFRNNARALLEDSSLASHLWQRAAPFVPRARDGSEAVGLHERFRFYRYVTAEQFGPHHDGCVSRGTDEVSKMTFMVYLSDVARGGETVFYAPGGVVQFSIRPVSGKALVFDHLRLHEGAPVLDGIKYVLRTDVMFRQQSTNAIT
jgi:predicted 2-oxoglutarate/Fe(II)-dependent dioxygenase YbiX